MSKKTGSTSKFPTLVLKKRMKSREVGCRYYPGGVFFWSEAVVWLLGKKFEKTPRDHGEEKNDDPGVGLGPCLDGLFCWQPLWRARQGKVIPSLSQGCFPLFGSRSLGRQVGNLVVPLVCPIVTASVW